MEGELKVSTTYRYKEQLERVKRYYERLKAIDEGKPQCAPSSADYEDDFYSFFVNCYQLKDWIKNDVSITLKKDVEQYINENSSLQICADICNGVKHLTITKFPLRSGKERKIESKVYSLTISEGSRQPPSIRIKFLIEKDLDEFDVAKDCVEKWNDYIKSFIQ
jgi:hypothetical protein